MKRRTSLTSKTVEKMSKGRVETSVSWEEASAKFYDYLALTNHSEYTIQSYKDVLRNVYKSLCIIERKPVLMSLVTTADIENLIRYYLDERKNRVSTVNQKLRTLSTFFTFVVKRGWTRNNPMDGVDYLRERNKEPEVLTAKDVQTIYKAIDPASSFMSLLDYTLFTLLIETGVRVTEACRLQLQDVDLVEKVITVSYTKNRKPRQVPISKRLLPVLETWVNERGTLDHDNLLVNTYNKPFARRNAQRRLHKLSELSGVPFSAHTCRRYFASSRLKAGADIFTLAKLMGHSSLDILKKYIGVDDEQKRRTVDL